MGNPWERLRLDAAGPLPPLGKDPETRKGKAGLPVACGSPNKRSETTHGSRRPVANSSSAREGTGPTEPSLCSTFLLPRLSVIHTNLPYTQGCKQKCDQMNAVLRPSASENPLEGLGLATGPGTRQPGEGWGTVHSNQETRPCGSWLWEGRQGWAERAECGAARSRERLRRTRSGQQVTWVVEGEEDVGVRRAGPALVPYTLGSQ